MKLPDFSPLVEELPATLRAEDIFARMCRLPHCLFLDSALGDPLLGRYSFLAADPFDYIEIAADAADGEIAADAADGLARLAKLISRFRVPSLVGLPPFQGGAAGVFGYELGRSLEELPRPAFDEFQFPAMAVGLYDLVVAMDHVDNRAWIISQGLPETDPPRRRQRAARRVAQMQEWLAAQCTDTAVEPPGFPSVDIDSLAPEFPVPGPDGLMSNFSAEGYLRAVGRIIEYIHAGDVFQVNLSQRLLFPADRDTPALYLRLRNCNPAPFAGYFDLGKFQIASASPERFLQVRGDKVETRPIKGTRQRVDCPQTDRRSERELRQSEKDTAENVMIVDLLRNDLSRVCRPESVEVSQLCEVERYEHVLHLVSAVCGRLRRECSPLDLVRASFPGGSITGAPKPRAMEIIAELEPTARGAYCGSLGYLGFDGSMDLNILIRTITAGRGWWQAPVGGGIVAQSDPQQEYEETWHKAEGLLRALR